LCSYLSSACARLFVLINFFCLCSCFYLHLCSCFYLRLYSCFYFSLCLSFSFSSHLIVLVEVARVDEVGSLKEAGGKLIRCDRLFGGWLVIQGDRKASWIGGKGLAMKEGSVLCYQGRSHAVKAVLRHQGKVLGHAIKAKSGFVFSSQVASGRVLGCIVKVGAIKAKLSSVHDRQSHHRNLWL
jgi:hypothetical protein